MDVHDRTSAKRQENWQRRNCLLYLERILYECPNCSKYIRAWDAIVDRPGVQLLKVFKCPFCLKTLEKEALTRVTETYFDSLSGQLCKRNKADLVWIHYKVGSERFEKSPDLSDPNTCSD